MSVLGWRCINAAVILLALEHKDLLLVDLLVLRELLNDLLALGVLLLDLLDLLSHLVILDLLATLDEHLLKLLRELKLVVDLLGDKLVLVDQMRELRLLLAS